MKSLTLRSLEEPKSFLAKPSMGDPKAVERSRALDYAREGRR